MVCLSASAHVNWKSSLIVPSFLEDIEMVVKDGKQKLVRFVDLGKMHDAFEKFSGKYMFMRKKLNFYFRVISNH